MLTGKSILVTGGTGSFGKKFVETVLNNYPGVERVVVFSRDELKQYEMSQVFSTTRYPQMRYFIGDVRDKERLHRAFHEVDVVVHAAALKQVMDTRPSGPKRKDFVDFYKDEKTGKSDLTILRVEPDLEYFKKLLLEIHTKPLSHQKEILEQKHQEWKGDVPQTDDIERALNIGIMVQHRLAKLLIEKLG